VTGIQDFIRNPAVSKYERKAGNGNRAGLPDESKPSPHDFQIVSLIN
jgi:hypothetical protein